MKPEVNERNPIPEYVALSSGELSSMTHTTE